MDRKERSAARQEATFLVNEEIRLREENKKDRAKEVHKKLEKLLVKLHKYYLKDMEG